MFHPKGPSVLNCHACILCGTKGAYVKNEQWIRVSTRETETERESKWFCKHRWLSLASLLVLHKCFEDILFFPRSPNFSSAATLLLFRTMFACLRLMPQLNTQQNAGIEPKGKMPQSASERLHLPDTFKMIKQHKICSKPLMLCQHY